MEPFLELCGVSKGFPGVQALQAVDLQIAAGEVHGLIGENGAGKSTLIKILGGMLRRDSGSVRIDGRPVEIHNPHQALRDLGIAVVHQEPQLVPEMSVAENILLGHFTGTGPGHVFLSREALRGEARRLLDLVGAHLDPDVLAVSLTMADQQLVTIARALSWGARLLILDEPTACLGNAETQRVLELVRQLRQQQVAVLFISHRLAEVLEISDRITVLRDGARVATLATADGSVGRLVRLMVGRHLSGTAPAARVPERGEPLLEVRGGTRRGALRQADLCVERGEIHGLAGLVGAGRSELARAVFGLEPLDGGEVRFAGRRVQIRHPGDAIALGIGLVPEDRKHQGVVAGLSVLENAALASLTEVSRLGLVQRSRQQSLVSEYVRKLSVKTASLRTPIQQLSGGNQQKVLLARWLMRRPRLLIVDEPTQGIDVGAKEEVRLLLREYTAQGGSVLLISSDLPELLGCSDRITIMYRGQTLATLTGDEATEERVMALCHGLGHGSADGPPAV